MFHSISITPCNIDVMVIVILGEMGMGYSPFIRELANSHVAQVLAMAPGSACHEQKNLSALIQWYITTHTHICASTCLLEIHFTCLLLYGDHPTS